MNTDKRADDLAYFERRAEFEFEQAHRSLHPEVAKVHQRLADLYRGEVRKRMCLA